MSKLAQYFFKRNKEQTNTILNRKNVESLAQHIIQIIFPELLEGSSHTLHDTQTHIELTYIKLKALLHSLKEETPSDATALATEFFDQLITISQAIEQDAQAIFDGDPAAKSIGEVVLCYPGFLAIAIYRVAHFFYSRGVPMFPRMLTEFAHSRTGVDIHPGAKIGQSFFIDHGTGIVIGETTIIGDRVKIYQGVTLGALSVEKSFAKKKRHPTIEDDVIIYSNATILGGETRIGHHSVIGGNVWLTQSVPTNSLVFSKSEIGIRKTSKQGPIDFCI